MPDSFCIMLTGICYYVVISEINLFFNIRITLLYTVYTVEIQTNLPRTFSAMI